MPNTKYQNSTDHNSKANPKAFATPLYPTLIPLSALLPFSDFSPNTASIFLPLPPTTYQDLLHSIDTKGLIHPITVWNGFILDGHHRYKAAQALQWQAIPCIDLSYLTKDQAESLFIESNFARRQLTTKEKVMAANALRDILSRQHQHIPLSKPISSPTVPSTSSNSTNTNSPSSLSTPNATNPPTSTGNNAIPDANQLPEFFDVSIGSPKQNAVQSNAKASYKKQDTPPTPPTLSGAKTPIPPTLQSLQNASAPATDANTDTEGIAVANLVLLNQQDLAAQAGSIDTSRYAGAINESNQAQLGILLPSNALPSSDASGTASQRTREPNEPENQSAIRENAIQIAAKKLGVAPRQFAELAKAGDAPTPIVEAIGMPEGFTVKQAAQVARAAEDPRTAPKLAEAVEAYQQTKAAIEEGTTQPDRLQNARKGILDASKRVSPGIGSTKDTKRENLPLPANVVRDAKWNLEARFDPGKGRLTVFDTDGEPELALLLVNVKALANLEPDEAMDVFKKSWQLACQLLESKITGEDD